MKKIIQTMLVLSGLSLSFLASCSSSSEDNTPAHTHNLEFVERVEATCTEDGNNAYYHCEECGENFFDEDAKKEASDDEIIIKAKGHYYNDWVIDPEATCTEDGLKSKSCINCDYVEDEIIPALGHDVTSIPGKTATCTEDGYTAESYCDRCGVVFEESIVVPALGHDYVDGVCTRCGAVREKTKGLEFELSDDGTYYILSGRGTATDKEIYVPEEYEGLPVKELGYRAFVNDQNIELIEIPSSIELLDVYSLGGCSNLNTVILHEGLKTISENAFYGDVSLEELTLPSTLTSIENRAFSYCYNLEKLEIRQGENNVYETIDNCLIEKSTKTLITGIKTSVIPDDGSVTSIGDYAFYAQAYITSITIPDSVKVIGMGAFSTCTNLKEIDLGNGVEELKTSVFYNCTNLKEVDLKGITKIGNDCFSSSGIETLIMYPENTFSYSTFDDFDSLEKIDFKGDIVEYCNIPSFGNQYLSNLGTSLYIDGKLISGHVVFPEGITTIPSYAFKNLTGITSVSLPSTLKTIKERAFENDIALTIVYNASSIDLEVGSDENGMVANYALAIKNVSSASGDVKNVNDFLVYTDEDETNWVVGYVGDASSLILPNSVNGGDYKVKSWAFYGNEATNITIPKTCIEIGEYGFYESKVVTLDIQGTKTIGEYAFASAIELTNLTLGEGVETIQSRAFDTNTIMYGDKPNKIKEIIFPNSLKTIGSRAFNDNENLEEVTFGTGLSLIEQRAFDGCKALTSATFKNTTNWKIADTKDGEGSKTISVTDPTTNATNLNDDYKAYYWLRG